MWEDRKPVVLFLTEMEITRLQVLHHRIGQEKHYAWVMGFDLKTVLP